ncbi:MAG: alpha/beta hydrolase [Peptococcaceae bacterium]|nr:alpha/beta hydrolase [Peptococcaceae bacterium]
MALTAKELNLRIMDLDICYIDTAAAAEEGGLGREILVLLHGWGASKESLGPVIENLKDRFRIVAMDLPGFGKSSEPDRPWTVEDYCAFLHAFLRETGLDGQRINAAGHSNGGRILIKWAAGSPTCLKRLLLIDSAGIPPAHGPDWYLKVYTYKAGKKLASLPGLKSLLGPVLEARQARAGSEDYRRATPMMKKTMIALLKEDLRDCLPQIKVPTLLIWGEGDTATPLSDGRLMEKLIPDAGLVVLKPAGHFSYLDQLPQFLRTVTYFLEH